LLIGPSGEFLLKTSKGAVTFDPPPIDGRSVAANYPQRRKPDSVPAEQAVERVEA
jgi:hypothetical protein